jgi:antitoxin MazE
MKATVTKWGNSLGIRIPSALAAILKIEEGGTGELEIQDGSLVLTPSRERLDALLKGVTPENVHQEFDWGGTEGREAW